MCISSSDLELFYWQRINLSLPVVLLTVTIQVGVRKREEAADPAASAATQLRWAGPACASWRDSHESGKTCSLHAGGGSRRILSVGLSPSGYHVPPGYCQKAP